MTLIKYRTFHLVSWRKRALGFRGKKATSGHHKADHTTWYRNTTRTSYYNRRFIEYKINSHTWQVDFLEKCQRDLTDGRSGVSGGVDKRIDNPSSELVPVLTKQSQQHQQSDNICYIIW